MTGFSEWVVPLLMTQLYDMDSDVHKCAVQVLDEAFDDAQNLNAAVALSSDMSHLVLVAAPLLLRFISTPLGFRMLSKENDYVAKEIDRWFEIGNLDYVARLEYELSCALEKPVMTKSTNLDQPVQFTFFGKTLDEEQFSSLYVVNSNPRDVTCAIPPHFFGELVKTHEGRNLLALRDYMSYFSEFIELWGLKNVSGLALLKVKAVLWALVRFCEI